MKKVIMLSVIMALLLSVVFVSAMAQGKNVFRTLSGWDMPPVYNGNPFIPGGVGGAGDYIFGRMFNYNIISGTFRPWIGTKFEDTSTELIIHLRKDLKWEDGVPFTSKDVYTTFYVGGAINTWAEVWQYVDEIETPDPYTVIFKYSKKKSILAKIFIMDKKIIAPYHIYGVWLKSAVNLVNSRKEMWKKENAGEDVSALEKEVSAKVVAFRKTLKEYKPAVPVGIGPFKLKRVTADEMVLVKRNDTPWAKTMKIDEVIATRYTTNELAWAQFMAGNVDIEKPTTPPDVVMSLMRANSKLRQVLVSDFSAAALVMNERKYPFSEKAFRQALAYVINRDEIRSSALYYGSSVKYPCGLIPSVVKTWTTPEFLATLNTYQVNYAKAEELLKSLGMYKGTDGFWKTKDGKKLQFEVAARQGYTDWIVAADVISHELTKFGIKTNTRIVQGALYGSTLLSGKYDMAIEFSVFAKFHPVQGYDRLYNGWIAKITGFNLNPVDKDLSKLVQELYVTENVAQQKAIVEKLAQATNEELPVIEYLGKRSQFFFLDGVRVTGWPEYTKSKTQPNVWIASDKMLNGFGYDWRQASVEWMANGILKPVH